MFAACAGRLSAQMEHQWLLSDSGANATERRRAQMIDLLDSVVGRDDRAGAMQIRLEAKLAQARLLSRADFGQDARAATRARALAARQVAACEAMLL